MSTTSLLSICIALALPAAAQSTQPWAGQFPIGLYDVPFEHLRTIERAGFNTIVNAYIQVPGYSAKAAKLGLKLIPYTTPQLVAATPKRDPIAAWYLTDEPDLNDTPPAQVAERYRALKALDPARPMFLTVWSPSRYADFIAYCDIFAVDPYAVVFEEAAKNDLTRVARNLDRARALAPDKPIWTVLQAFFALPWWTRSPSSAELRAMAYLAVNHGTQGILYFAFDADNAHHRTILDNAPLFEMMTKINGELRDLSPWLLAPAQRQPLRITIPGSRVDVAILRGVPGQKDWMMVVNPDETATQVEVPVPGRRKAQRIELRPFEVKRFRL